MLHVSLAIQIVSKAKLCCGRRFRLLSDLGLCIGSHLLHLLNVRAGLGNG